MEIALGDVAAADLVGGNAGLLGDDAGRQLFRRHFEGEEADDAAIGGLNRTVGARSPLINLGDVEGDIGGERRLAHAGTAGEDDEIGRLQAAHIAVEVGQPGGDAAQRPFALVGAGGHVDSDFQRFGEALKAAVVPPGLGDLVQAPLGLLDLVARARIDRRVKGDIDDILADRNEFAPHGEVIDAAAIVVGVDDGRRLAGETGEILRHSDAAEIMLAKEGLERHRRRQLAGPDQRSRDLEDAAMNFLDEMLASEEVRDAVERVIVDQDRAEQRLFGLEVVRRRAIGALLRQRLALGELFDRRHGCGASLYEGWTLRHAERLTHDKTYPRTAATTSHPCSQTRRAARAKAATSDEKKKSGENRDVILTRASRLSAHAFQAQTRFFASAYSRASRATSSATGCTDLTAPMPWPLPQMSRHALASLTSDEPREGKFIALASPCGRASGSSPDLTIEGLR